MKLWIGGSVIAAFGLVLGVALSNILLAICGGVAAGISIVNYWRDA